MEIGRMRRIGLAAVLVALALAALGLWLSGSSADPAEDDYSTYEMIPDAYLGPGIGSVIEFAMIPGRPNEAIVASQSGNIYRVALDGSFSPVLWGDVQTKVTFGGEQGLLSVAFAPDFTDSGRVYLYYTPGSPADTVLARYQATETDLDEGSEEVLLEIEEFATNHNGGHIAFDSSGYLYLSLGDGGGGGDPNEKAQDLTTLLGKVLRIDVSGVSGYAIPPGNPFGDGGGPIREEIFAYGFRNPWRMTVDPDTDDVWLGDVGQGEWEEVDLVTAGGNYGWDCYEGNAEYELTGCPPAGTMVFPRAVYSHSFGQAVTGGAVYRGSDMPELYGWYVYSDFYSGHVWAVDPATSDPPVHLLDAPFNVSSFTLMPDGEIAIVSYNNGVHRLTREDADGDGVAASADNCPEWPNPAQEAPDWPIRNDDPDCDGWSSNREDFVGTVDNAQCAATATQNDEPLPDVWPVDFDDNQMVDGADVLKFGIPFLSVAPGPPYAVRFDFNGDSFINGADVLQFGVFFLKRCDP